MKPRKPLSLAVAAATLLTASFSPSASAELTDREASIVPIAAFTANGNQEQLKKALAKGLDNGLTVNEIKAVLEQMYAYTGFPRSLTALGVYVKLLDERKAAGLKDTVGREPTPLPESADLHQIGTKTQTELVGRPVAGPVYTFSPNIDTYLKDHLFDAIFANDRFGSGRPARSGTTSLAFKCLHECRPYSRRTFPICRRTQKKRRRA